MPIRSRLTHRTHVPCAAPDRQLTRMPDEAAVPPEPPGGPVPDAARAADSGLAPQQRRDDICVHIFTTSATLVGVCLTVIGVLRLVQRLHDVNTLADELLSIDALIFLGACVISYVALRTDPRSRRQRIERLADFVFLGGLGLMTVICALIASKLL